METKRRQAIAETRAQIIKYQIAQKRDQEILNNLPRLNLNTEIKNQKKESLSEAISKRNLEISALEEKQKEIASGNYDVDLTKMYKDERDKQKIHSDAIKKRKQEKAKEDEDEKAKVFAKENNRNREERYMNKDFTYYYKVYSRIHESLPPYIHENLSEMPGNKGYIWRGCWFFGLNPPERNQPCIMFEKMQGGVLRIHEIDQYEIKTFEKMGKERKRLISTKQRRKITRK